MPMIAFVMAEVKNFVNKTSTNLLYIFVE